MQKWHSVVHVSGGESKVQCYKEQYCIGIQKVRSMNQGKLDMVKQWHPTPVLLPGKSHGQRNLVGYSPRGRKESDMAEWLHFHFPLRLWACLKIKSEDSLRCLPGVLFSLFKPGDAATFHELRDHISEQHHNHTQHLAQHVFNLQFVAIT